ncbi:ESPR-type extended signal peptide-containing protein [Acinetobacter dispersus]|uniref:ESPR-type extended signal peptide-containing protein n=1 Tax=Acinetobacter dispersus TaxID=70348 RepID=UPI00132EFFEE|nr:ESPR-type extended signal peptide-containing protein [Acinetobacter dispersus]QHH98132.1 hypothetical protein FPL17_11430 [Acinetobacter dispersus]
MNKIYRLVWNKKLNLWTVVSENTRGVTKNRNVGAIAAVSTEKHKGLIDEHNFNLFKLNKISNFLKIIGILVFGSLGIPQVSLAATYTGSQPCSAAGGTGPDGATHPNDTNPVNGSGTWSNVIGCNSNGNGYNGVQVVGPFARATGAGATTMGFASEATTRASAYGMRAQASGTQSTAVGSWAQASGTGSVALGSDGLTNNRASGARASGNQAVAIAGQAKATGDKSIAIGHASNAEGSGDLALGQDAYAKGVTENGTVYTATAVGAASRADGKNTTAVGQNSKATALGASAFGALSEATAQYGSALGNGSKATADFTTAIGNRAEATAIGATVAGSNSTAKGELASGFGALVNAEGARSTAVGTSAQGIGASSVAVGDNAQANADRALALGANAVANNADDVALGAGSTTSTATGAGYRTGTAAPNSVVSVGTAGNERRIQNLSDGAADTDAVNVRQLKNVQDGVDQLGESTADALGGGSSYDPSTGTVSNPTYNVNGKDVNNVGAAITELDKGWNLQSNGANTGAVKAGDTVDIGTVTGEENLTVTKNGNTIQYGLNKNLKVDSITAGDTVLNDNGVSIANGPSMTKDGIDAGNKTISNIADGVDANDAVNKGQLDKSSQDLTDKGFGLTAQDGSTVQKKLGEAVEVVGADSNITTKVQDGKVAIELAKDLDVNSIKAGDTVINNDGMSIANGPSVTKSGINAAGNTISNVGPGVAGTDAVNKDQLDSAAAAAKTIVTEGDNIVVTESKNADGSTNYEVATAKDLKVDSITAGDTVLNDNGVSIANGPSMTKDGIDAGNKTISNIADGVDANDAVNKGQLDKSSQDLTDKGFGLTAQDGSTVQKKLGEAVEVVGADSNITTKVQDGKVAIELAKDLDVNSIKAGDTVINNDGMSIANGPSVTKSGINAAGNTISNVGPGVAGTDAVNKDQLDSAAAAAKTIVTEGDNIVVTESKNADGSTNYEVATAKDLKVDSVTAGDTVLNDNGVSIANGPSMTKDGIDAGNKTISNVADGVADSDAVNKGQLDKSSQDLTDKGFGLTAQDGSTVQKKLGEAVEVVGADSNITTKVEDGKVAIELAKELDVNSVKAGDTVINNDGMSIANGPSITKSGIDAAGNTISNVGPGVAGTDAVNKDQLDSAAAAAKTIVTEGDNIVVTESKNADGSTNYEVATAKDLKVDSITAGDTVLNDNGVSIANGPSMTKDGIDAGNKTISNIADGVDANDAVNKGQLDKSSQDLTDKGFGLTAQDGSTVQKKLGEAVEVVGADSNITTKVQDGKVAIELAKELDVNSIKAGDTVINNDGMSITGGPSVTKSGIDAAGSTISNVGPGVAGTDAVNKDQLDSAAAAAKTEVEAGKNMTVESETGADGQTIYTVATADDVEFNNVKVGDVSIDGSTGKIDGLSDGTVAAGSKEAVNGGQLHSVADSVKTSIGGETTLNPDGTVTTSNVGNTGQNNIHDAIDSVRGQAAAAKTEVTEGKNITVTKTTGNDGQDIYNVATADDVEFDSVKVGDVTIDGTTGKISGVAAGDVNPNSTDAINGSQLANNAQSVADALGGGSTVNPDGTVSKPNYTVNGDSLNNVGDAITALDKGWTLQSNGANAAAVKAGDTVDIGTADGEENLQVTKEGNDIKYSLNRDLKVDSVTAGDTVINNDGMTITGGPSVTKSGIDVAGNKISNVAAGTEGTDAVNKDQLDNAAAAAKTEVTEGKNITVTKTTGDDGQDIYNVATADDVEFNNVKVGDVTIDGTTGKISGVAAGDVNPNSTDAINGSQLHAQGEGVKNIIGGNTTYDPATGQYTNPDIGGTGKDNINDAISAVGDAAKAAKTTVKEGENIVVTESKNADGSTNYEVATAKDVKFDSVTATDEEGNETVLTATGTQVKDGEGNEAEYGAKGISLKDQEGKGTLINQDGMSFVDAAGNNIGPSITAGGINAGNTVITGVAAGRVAADSQDAINGSQLHGVADSVKNIIGGNTTVNPDGTLSGSNIGGTGKDNINDAIGAVGDAAKAAKSTVSNKDGNISVNETIKPDGSRDYEVGLAKDIKVDSVTAGGTKVDGDGLHIDGGPSVTKDGIDAGDKKVTGVADGEIAKDSKDAVNGGQLHDVADSVKNVVGGNTTVNPDGTISTSNVGGTGHNNINDAIASVKQDAQAAKSTVSNKDGNIKVNETTKADGSKDYEVGLADKIKVKEVDVGQVNVTGDKGSTTITGGGISITGPKGEAGPSMTTDGINAGGKKVTGVADGTIASGSKDAINGGQLHQSYQDVGAALGGGAGYDPEKGWKGPTYNIAGSNYNNVGDALGALNQADQALDNRITNLGDQMQQAFYDTNRRIDDVEKKANAGVAAAIALEAAPFVAGKYTYAVGAAYHGGENAFGATLRKTADNGRWSLTGGVAAASQGDPSFRLGLSGVID